MLKKIIYFNINYLFIISIYLLIISNKNNKRIEKHKVILQTILIYNIISIVICLSGIVQIDWDAIVIVPITIIAIILNVISIYKTNKIIKEQQPTNSNSSLLYKAIIIIPVILFVISYSFELYVLNNCNYLLKYNYQNGIVISEDTYIAIINNKPITITLLKNIFNREAISVTPEKYEVKYNKKIEISTRNSMYEEIVDNKKIEEIALSAKQKCYEAEGASILYLPNGEYAIVKLLSNRDYGLSVILDEYFYYKDDYVKSIKTDGSLESIMYYGN